MRPITENSVYRPCFALEVLLTERKGPRSNDMHYVLDLADSIRAGWL